jgi:hypothetical protein
VVPVVGVGVALSESGGDPEGLVRAARETASRAARSLETSVLMSGAE